MTERDRLKQHLQTLHEELEGPAELDRDMRVLLRQLNDDISRVLDEGGTEEDDDLRRQVQEAAANFAAEHPRTERLLREIADTLAKLGI